MLVTFGMAASVDKRTQQVPVVGACAIENHLACPNDIPARGVIMKLEVGRRRDSIGVPCVAEKPR